MVILSERKRNMHCSIIICQCIYRYDCFLSLVSTKHMTEHNTFNARMLSLYQMHDGTERYIPNYQCIEGMCFSSMKCMKVHNVI